LTIQQIQESRTTRRCAIRNFFAIEGSLLLKAGWLWRDCFRVGPSNAAAFGADGVLLSPGCCDPLYRKAIRTSVGAALQIKFARVLDWPSGLTVLRTAGFSIFALTANQDAVDVARLDPAAYHRVALLLGNEGSGLRPETEGRADLRVTIRMRPLHDSLNVATAAGIAMHRMFAPVIA
jgi:tRNA G18 (ribose-2'-O)-methylase SpoU